MSNAFMENFTYNLTKIVSTDIIDDPTQWIFNFNSEMGGTIIIAGLATLAIVLFLLARNLENVQGRVKDSEAAVYSGLIVSVIGLLLFFIEVGGEKILTFEQLLIFLVATGIAILINSINRYY